MSILNIEEEPAINDDEECASRQIVRHVAVALKRYMEAHLHLKAEQLQRAENVRTDRDTWQPSLPPYKVRYPDLLHFYHMLIIVDLRLVPKQLKLQ